MTTLKNRRKLPRKMRLKPVKMKLKEKMVLLRRMIVAMISTPSSGNHLEKTLN